MNTRTVWVVVGVAALGVLAGCGDGSASSACPEGSWAPGGDAGSVCVDWTLCPAGQYEAVTATATSDRVCAPCMPGSNEPACAARDCVPGEFRNTAGAGTSGPVCTSCPSGTFSVRTNASSCAPWRTCEAGQYVVANGESGGDRICRACPSGQFNVATNAPSCTRWTDCEAGERVLGLGSEIDDRTCLACPLGTYTSGPNQTACVGAGDCHPGTVQTVPATSTTPATCVACAAGQHCAGAASPVVVCGGMTWDHDADPATACVPRTNCLAGTAVSSDGDATHDRVCTPCVPGRYSSTTNAAACAQWTACAAGTYVSGNGDATHDRTCTACMPGWYNIAANADTCTQWTYCGGGTYVSAPGTATSDRSCRECPLGSYSVGSMVSMCTPWQVCAIDYAEGSPGTSGRDRTCVPTGWTLQFGTDDTDEALAVSTNDTRIAVGGRVDGALPQQTDAGGWDAFVQMYLSNGTLLWTRQFGTEFNDQVVSVSTGSDDSVIVAGYLAVSGTPSYFLRKYSASGVELWTRSLPWIAVAVAVASDDSVVVVGHGTRPLPDEPASMSADVVVQKYSSAGTLLWTRQFGSTLPDVGTAVSVEADGDIFVAGYVREALPGQTFLGTVDAFLQKYDALGTPVFTRQFGTSSADLATGVSVGGDGGVVIVGHTSGTLPSQTSLGSADAFVRKYDSDGGVILWTRQFGAAAVDYATAVSVGGDGRVLVTGVTDTALPGQSDLGGTDAFLVTYSPSGGLLRTRQFGTSGPDMVVGVSALSDANAVVGGWVTYALPGQATLGGADAFLRAVVDP